MELKIEPLKCIGCGACELACSFFKDNVFTTMRSSIMLYLEEKKNYFGVVLKRAEDVVLGRPEGVQVQRPTDATGGGARAKPILLREACNLCDGEPTCIKFCPTGCLQKGDA